jgi:hypothetical protein
MYLFLFTGAKDNDHYAVLLPTAENELGIFGKAQFYPCQKISCKQQHGLAHMLFYHVW